MYTKVEFRIFLIALFVCLYYSTNGYAQVKAISLEKKYNNELTQYSNELLQKIDSNDLVIFIGSSTIRRWADLKNYFPESNVINHGFGGSKLPEAIYFADRLIYQYKPAQIVFYEGDNDLGSGVSVESLLTDLKVFVRLTEIKLPKTEIVLLAIKYSPFRRDKMNIISEYNNQMKIFAASQKNVRFIDISIEVLTQSRTIRGELFAPDSLHVNAKGYELFAKRIEPYLLKRRSQSH